jgi:alpha-methylacyl-CoA racemase
MTTALDGIKVVDVSGIGAYASMILGDFGAQVTRVSAVPGTRRGVAPVSGPGLIGAASRLGRTAGLSTHRGNRDIAVNLKTDDGRAIVQSLAKDADVFLESFRPGVCDRLGVGYAELSALNPRLVYASLTGYGQTGPYRDKPGHDLNYIAMGGALGFFFGEGGRPFIPLNILADFAGGGLYTCLGICMALLARDRTGRGQHVDMAMSDGVLSLLTATLMDKFEHNEDVEHRKYFLNGGVPHYDTYRCADDRWISVACLETHFYANLCRGMGLEEFLDAQFTEERYPALREALSDRFALKPRDEWVAALDAYDVCVAPVLEQGEIANHPHIRARGTITEVDSPAGPKTQVGVGPKLSETPGSPGAEGPSPGQHTDAILRDLGYDAAGIAALREGGAVG